MQEYFNKDDTSIWVRKGATLSDSSACKEFGLAKGDLIDAINKGRMQYRLNNVYGNPWFKLLRHEVEAFVSERYGQNYLNRKKLEKDLSEVNKELKKLKSQILILEQKRNTLLESLSD